MDLPFIKAFKAFGRDLAEEFHNTDPDLKVKAAEVKAAGKVRPLADASGQRLLRALFACPHGVQAMSQDIPGLVQTSTNLACVKLPDNSGIASVITSQRSSAASERRAVAASESGAWTSSIRRRAG